MAGRIAGASEPAAGEKSGRTVHFKDGLTVIDVPARKAWPTGSTPRTQFDRFIATFRDSSGARGPSRSSSIT